MASNSRGQRPGATMWTMAASSALAVFCALVLHVRVYTDFEPIRWKVVKTETASLNGLVSIRLPPSPRLAELRAPVVMIASVRNPLSVAVELTASLDGQPAGSLGVPAQSRTRLDIASTAVSGLREGSVVELKSLEPGWVLENLELANIHGSTRAFPRLMIVPRTLEDHGRPPLWFAVLVGAAILVLRVVQHSIRRPRWVLYGERLLTAVIVGLFGATLVSGTLVSFKVLLAPGSFLLSVCLLTAPALIQLFRIVRAEIAGRRPSAQPAIGTLLVATAIACFYATAMFAFLEFYRGNYSGLLTISREFAAQVPFLAERRDLLGGLILHESGYDGQFAYAMAFDPFLDRYKDRPGEYRAVVDAPPYRYGRIGFSLLTKLVSGDRPERYPATMVWLIIAGHFIAGLFLAAIMAHHGRSPAWALLYVLIPGFLQSLRVALPESIAAAGLLGGYWCWLTSRYWPAAALFGLSLLVRETGAILLVALVLHEGSARRIHSAAVLAAGFLPLLSWRGYVSWRLFADWKWEGFFFNPGNMGVPFAGFADLWSAIARGSYMPGAPHLATAGTVYPVVLTGALMLAVALLRYRRTALSGAIVAYAFVAVSLNYTSIWVHIASGERGTYESLLLLIVAWAALERGSRLHSVMLGYFACLAAYLLFASVDRHILSRMLALPMI